MGLVAFFDSAQLLSGAPPESSADSGDYDQDLQQFAYLPFLDERMAQRKLRDDLVTISPALSLSQDVAIRDKLRQDPMSGALRDADCLCDVAKPRPRVVGYAEENVGVIREEIPLGR